MDLKLLASNIDAECRKRGTNVNKMLLECGLSKATVDNIKMCFLTCKHNYRFFDVW